MNLSRANLVSKRRRAARQPLRRWVCRAVAGFSAAGVLASGGCKKAEAPPPAPATVQVAGVKLDVPKLDTEFQAASPEIQAALTEIKKSYRGGRFAQMAAQLEALGNNPGLTAPQKKLVGDLLEEVKQLLAKIPAPPG